MKLLRKLFSPCCLIISCFIFLYIFYKSEVSFNPSFNENHYFGHYLFSILLIVFSISTFFLKKNFKDYIIITTFTLLTCIYLAEAIIIFKKIYYTNSKYIENFNLIKKTYEEKNKKKYDTRTKLEVYNDLKKTENNVSVTVRPNFHIKYKDQDLFPLSGLSNSNTIYCNENGYYSIFKSDRYGFNNPDNQWDKDKIEFLLIGDSFTLGACVNRPNDIASVLRLLSKKSALNLGYSGNGPLIEYATLKEYLSDKVNNIIWIYTENNDLINLKKELKNNILKQYILNQNFTQNLKLNQNQIDKKIIKIIETNKGKSGDIELKKNNIFSQFKIKNFIKLVQLRSLISNSKQNYKNRISENLFIEFENILLKSKKIALDNNSNFYFVYLPEHQHYLENYDDKNYIKVINIIKKLEINLIDIHQEVFSKHSNPMDFFPFESPLHYNELGYKKIAETINKLVK